LQRIEEAAVRANFVVEVIPGGAPGGAETPDDIATFDGLSGFD